MTDDDLVEIMIAASDAAKAALDEAIEKHGPYDPESETDYGPEWRSYVYLPARTRLAEVAWKNGFAQTPDPKREWVVFEPHDWGWISRMRIKRFLVPTMEAMHRELLRTGEDIRLHMFRADTAELRDFQKS